MNGEMKATTLPRETIRGPVYEQGFLQHLRHEGSVRKGRFEDALLSRCMTMRIRSIVAGLLFSVLAGCYGVRETVTILYTADTLGAIELCG